MIDFYLRFDSEVEANTALDAFFHQPLRSVVDEETGETTHIADGAPYLVMNTADYAIDVVGEISEPTGVTLYEEGYPYPEMAPVPGWHVNIRLINDTYLPEMETLSAYHVTPDTPHRVWA